VCDDRVTLTALYTHPKQTVWFHCVQAQAEKLHPTTLQRVMAGISRRRGSQGAGSNVWRGTTKKPRSLSLSHRAHVARGGGGGGCGGVARVRVDGECVRPRDGDGPRCAVVQPQYTVRAAALEHHRVACDVQIIAICKPRAGLTSVVADVMGYQADIWV